MSRGMHLGHVAKASVSGAIQACFDGKYVWVTNSGYTKVFEVWANSTADMGVDPVLKVTEVAQVSDIAPNYSVPDESVGPVDCGFLTYGGGYMYITLKKQWSLMDPVVEGRSKMLFDCILKVHRSTRQIVEIIRTPISETHRERTDLAYSHLTHEYIMMNSVIHYCDGKLWMVEDYLDAMANGGVQRVWIYDIYTGIWTSQTFAGKMQKNRAQITSANGIVYIAAYNSLSVLKYNAATTSFINSVKGNANPNAMCPTPDGRILVTSYKGLISHLNLDDTWTHDLQCETDECTAIAYQSNDFCWTVDGESKLFRVGADNFVYGSGYDGEDYKLLNVNSMENDPDLATRTDITKSPLWDRDVLALQGDMIDLDYNSLNGYEFSATIDSVNVIQPIKYQKWNGSTMVDVDQPALVVLLTDSEVVVINTSEIKFGFPRPAIVRSTMSAVGVGMISFGPNDYTGD